MSYQPLNKKYFEDITTDLLRKVIGMKEDEVLHLENWIMHHPDYVNAHGARLEVTDRNDELVVARQVLLRKIVEEEAQAGMEKLAAQSHEKSEPLSNETATGALLKAQQAFGKAAQAISNSMGGVSGSMMATSIFGNLLGGAGGAAQTEEEKYKAIRAMVEAGNIPLSTAELVLAAEGKPYRPLSNDELSELSMPDLQAFIEQRYKVLEVMGESRTDNSFTKEELRIFQQRNDELMRARYIFKLNVGGQFIEPPWLQTTPAKPGSGPPQKPKSKIVKGQGKRKFAVADYEDKKDDV